MGAGLFLNAVLEVPASPLLLGILLTLFLGPVSFMMLVLLFGFDSHGYLVASQAFFVGSFCFFKILRSSV